MYIDPIADLCVRVKNATKARHQNVLVHTSKTISSILKVLMDEGYIANFEQVKRPKSKKVTNTLITLKYKNNMPSINGIKQISKPGLKVYQSVDKLPRVLNGLGVAVISTSKGIVTDKVARKNNLGGEVIAYVW
ncbi:MAG: 30S ribosomal protein S8 [Mycoplasmataceae bacterium]|nr:30S ribosomal protein S8 [Mycoplasmataceae bacterium]